MLTLEFLPYSEIENLSSIGRIRKLLTMAKDDKIVLLQGRLKKEEEAELIKTTMEEINKDFKGIELAVIYPEENAGSVAANNAVASLKKVFVNYFLGDRIGFTIVGPANIVKDIKKDPNKIQLFTEDAKNGKKKSNGEKKNGNGKNGNGKNSEKSSNNGKTSNGKNGNTNKD